MAEFVNHNIIYSDSIIGHDTRLGNNNFLATAVIGSESTVENGAFMGMRSTLRDSLVVGDYAFVGMGANVTSNVESRQIVFGNPAKPSQSM